MTDSSGPAPGLQLRRWPDAPRRPGTPRFWNRAFELPARTPWQFGSEIRKVILVSLPLEFITPALKCFSRGHKFKQHSTLSFVLKTFCPNWF